MWVEFTQEYAPRDNRTWAERRYRGQAQWYAAPPPPGAPVTLHHWNGQPLVLSGEGLPIALLNHPLNPQRRGLVRAAMAPEPGQIDLSYLGPDDLWIPTHP